MKDANGMQYSVYREMVSIGTPLQTVFPSNSDLYTQSSGAGGKLSSSFFVNP